MSSELFTRPYFSMCIFYFMIYQREEANAPNIDFPMTKESNSLLDLRTTEAVFVNKRIVSESDIFACI